MSKIVGIDLGTTNSKDKKLFMRRFFGGKFSSHNIGNDNQRGGNPEQDTSNLGTIKNFIKLFCSHKDSMSQIIATSKNTIANTNASVNLVVSRLTNPGEINMRAIQPADRLPLIPERTLKNDFLTAFTLAKMGICYNNSDQVEFGRSAFAKASADEEESTN